MMILQEVWKAFRFPVFIGLIFGIGWYFFLTHYDKEPVLASSILFGFWMFCVPFGLRTISGFMSKMNQGWFRSLLNGFIKFFTTVAVSLTFAPAFFVIQLIALLRRIWQENKGATIH